MNNNLGKDTLKWLRTYGYCLNSEGEKKYKVDIILSEFTFIDSKKKAVNEVIQEEVPF